ncbi:NAD(+) synthase [Myxococcota bacterium]|nr:NAD(+) synthase [Myxococcota bacterium]
MDRPFRNLYSHGFARVAVCLPHVRIADPVFNGERTLALARRAAAAHAALAVFPELGLSAYSNDDLFHQDALLDAVLEALGRLVEASADLLPVLLVGAPLRFSGALYNCAVAVHRGRVLGVAPKTHLPGYREFYERRQFTPGRFAPFREVRLLGRNVPFGADQVFVADDVPGLAVHAEVCEDVWVPIPPSSYAALAGATVLSNLSASNVTLGKAEWRRTLCASQSGRCVAAYLYSAAGPGESTTDLAWDGHALVYEAGDLLAESERFAEGEQVLLADVDLDRIVQERTRATTFHDDSDAHRERVAAFRRVPFTLAPPRGAEVPLLRAVERFPYVPADPRVRDARCYEAFHIQVQGLAQRLSATGIGKVAIGVSGGLDSTHALIVAARTMDRLGRPRADVLGYSLPGFATGETTRANALALMRALGVTAAEVDIRPSAMQMLRDIGHPYADGQPVYDVTFENVQAGERTSHLFRLANLHGGLVLGTGDLSEIALGWSTYGVGDQMSHYNVNASVPKTLIQHLVRWVVATGQFDAATRAVLASISDTEITPELVPAAPGAGEGGACVQSSEAVVGPYELQDFHTFWTARYGFRPSKVAFLALHAWGDRDAGTWPDFVPPAARRQYDLPAIKHWLGVFLDRFFRTSQFKRTALPAGPKVGSGGSLSPRGDWRAPADAPSTTWLDELRRNVPDE